MLLIVTTLAIYLLLQHLHVPEGYLKAVVWEQSLSLSCLYPNVLVIISMAPPKTPLIRPTVPRTLPTFIVLDYIARNDYAQLMGGTVEPSRSYSCKARFRCAWLYERTTNGSIWGC